MLKPTLAALIVALAMTSGAAAAGPRDDDAFPVRGSPIEAEQALDSFARCVAETRVDFARDVLVQPLGSKEQVGIIHAHMPNGPNYCLGSQSVKLVFRPFPFVGGMASYFVSVRYRNYDLPGMVRGAPAPTVERAPERFGLCVVRQDPAAATTLVRIRFGAPEEEAAFSALQPALSACVKDGATFHLDKLAIRSALAVVLYRYAAAAEAGAPK